MRKHLNYNDNSIDKLPIDLGVKYLEWLYDEQMQQQVTNLGLHGIDIKDSKQCSSTYKMWLSRKNRESEPPPELTLTPEQAESINNVMQKEIDKAVGKRNLRCQTKP